MDLSIFDPLLQKRPEISAAKLELDLDQYYLPFLKQLIELKKQKHLSHGLLIGVSAIQGAGKSTQGEIMEILLQSKGLSSISRSIDDHYITHQQLCQLRQKDPRYIRRGVTHDIQLAIQDLKNLEQMSSNQPILVAGYFKGAHHGDGDRFRFVNPEEGVEVVTQVTNEELVVNKVLTKTLALHLKEVTYKGQPVILPDNMGSDIPIAEHLFPESLCEMLIQSVDQEVRFTGDATSVKVQGQKSLSVKLADLPNGWRVIHQKPDFIFYDGWMLGARKVEDLTIFDSGLPALETAEDRQFAIDVNNRLPEYDQLWQMMDFLSVLYVHNYQMSLKWRDQAEEALRQKGEGMSHQEIEQFIHYFWRSVHPAIHIKNLACDSMHTDQVVVIGDDHGVVEVLKPEEVKHKYV